MNVYHYRFNNGLSSWIDKDTAKRIDWKNEWKKFRICMVRKSKIEKYFEKSNIALVGKG